MNLAALIARATMVQDRTRSFWRLAAEGETIIGQTTGTDMLAPFSQDFRTRFADLGSAPLYAVSVELVDLLEVVRLDVPAYAIQEVDLKSPDGFAVFSRPMALGFHADGEPVVVDGLAWQSSPLELRTESELIFSYLRVMTTSDARRLVALPASADDSGEGLFYGRRFGERMSGEQSQLFRAWVRLLNERIVVERREHDLGRAVRRQVARTRSPEAGEVSAWLLREPVRRASDESGEWRRLKNRHIVQPHWHPYWHGAGANRRSVPHLLDAYIKGPADAPLVLRRRIGAVVR